jgi:hypothetical protein
MEYGEDETTSGAAGEPASFKDSASPAKDNPDDSAKALVEQWCERIKKAKKHWEKDFKRMKENTDFAALGGDKKWVEAGKYTVPIISQIINTAVDRIYARNPTTVAERRRRLMYKIWDGRIDTLQNAMRLVPTGDPGAMAVIQEVMAVRNYELMLDRLGQTLALAYQYFTDEQAANFKQQIKAAVRRAKTVGVAYIKIGFQRILEPRPEITARINDVRSKIAAIECILNEVAKGEVDEHSAKMTELKTMMFDLQRQENLVAREGLIFDFPRAREIIVDPACRHLKSFSGARWVAQEYEMAPDAIYDVYKVDVKGDYRRYRSDGKVYDDIVDEGEECVARVYEIYDKRNQQVLVICEGHNDFLKAPSEPDLKIDRFFPWVPIVFNEVEHEERIFPPSDVEHAKHMQNEYNRSREALRQHRIAARPYYVEGGTMEEEEKKKLQFHADHEVITLPSLAAGEKIEDKLQRGPTAPIDPNLYEVEMIWNDMLRSVGVQEATLGSTSGSTATESSIAENSQGTAQSSNVDDLEEALSELAHAGGQILLTEMSKEKIEEIVGPGAVWPELPQTREEVSKDIFLKIKTGSSGRPNQAAEAARIERVAPMLIQIPGVNPRPLIEKFARVAEIDVDELYADGMPSITALNAMMAKMGAGLGGEPTGDPDSDPNQQGAEGSQNAPNPQTEEPGPQPSYPAPMAIP